MCHNTTLTHKFKITNLFLVKLLHISTFLPLSIKPKIYKEKRPKKMSILKIYLSIICQ